jgi:sulfur carrier protein ThiS
MKIYLNFSTSLFRSVADRVDKKSQTVEVEAGVSVRELLISLIVPLEDVGLVFVNGVETDADQRLGDGDRLGVFPVAAGG